MLGLPVSAHASATLDFPPGLFRGDEIVLPYLTQKSSAPADAINPLCARAFLGRLQFQDIDHPVLRNRVDYCRGPLGTLPSDARRLIEAIGEVHRKVSLALELSPAEVFAVPIKVLIRGKSDGSMKSKAGPLNWGPSDESFGVALDSLPNWDFSDFASSVYAHEVAHLLSFSAGPVGEALRGLQEHPFLIEAFPDLVSAVAHDTPKFLLGERDLPACLRDFRDGTPVQSLDRPFGDFYVLAQNDKMAACCAGLDLRGESELAQSLCENAIQRRGEKIATLEAFTSNKRLDHKPFSPESLAEPFSAGNCRVRTATGLVYFDACDTHRFGKTLMSFFFRLKELTGKHQLGLFVSKLRTLASTASLYRCGFSEARKGSIDAKIEIRSALGGFRSLRGSLNLADQARFDQAWKEHAMEKFEELDRLYQKEALPGFAQIVAKFRNPDYSREHACGDVYEFDSKACRVSCVQVR